MTSGPPEDGRRAEHFPCFLRSEPPSSGDWYKELGNEIPDHVRHDERNVGHDGTNVGHDGRDVGHDGRESW